VSAPKFDALEIHKGEATMPTRERVQQLISLVQQGKVLDALEEFYADEVTMQENNHPPTVGKAANRKREEEFMANVAEMQEAQATEFVVDGDHAAIHYVFEFTDRNGKRFRIDEIAWQTWRDDKIVSERFYYDTAAMQG
jgi:ketosteroid isomerase-like protein